MSREQMMEVRKMVVKMHNGTEDEQLEAAEWLIAELKPFVSPEVVNG